MRQPTTIQAKLKDDLDFRRVILSLGKYGRATFMRGSYTNINAGQYKEMSPHDRFLLDFKGLTDEVAPPAPKLEPVVAKNEDFPNEDWERADILSWIKTNRPTIKTRHLMNKHQLLKLLE